MIYASEEHQLDYYQKRGESDSTNRNQDAVIRADLFQFCSNPIFKGFKFRYKSL